MQHARARPADAEPELDLVHLAQLIRTGRAAPDVLERWLQSTYREPARFRRAMYLAAASKRSEAIKSRPDLGLDLYADCVSCHLGRQRAALVVVQEGRSSEISYETLHVRCSALASEWKRAGVAAGDSLALLAPVGLDYCVALLTGLRLGLMVTPIPPLGATYARNRLAFVAADHVAAPERLAYMLPADGSAPLPLAAHGGDASLATSHAYAPGDGALRLLSPFGSQYPDATLAELSALSVHEALLRDSMFVLALEPGERIAAPGWDALQLQPLALLSTLIAGATWVECTAAEVAAEPQRLSQLGVSVLGVDARLRELIRERGAETCAGVRSWFRSLTDRLDYDKWRSFGELFAQREISQFSVLYNAASGGAQLFSPRIQRDDTGRLWPAPGRNFLICQVGTSLLPSLDTTGVYTPLCDDEADPTLPRMVISKLDQGWTLGGCIDLGPEARTLPVDEIAACARKHPSVGAASVVLSPGRWPNEAHSLLLVFVPEPDAAVSGSVTNVAGEVRQLIARELGDRHVPERVEIFALRPRYDGERLRRDWCASQYLSGMLGRKARVPLFLTLSRLSWIFAPPTNS